MKNATKARRVRAREVDRPSAAMPSSGGTGPHVAGGFGVSGYDAANWTSDRGFIYWPTLDPKFEVDTFSRREVARKAHYLCANVGLAQRIIEGLTNLIVGTGLMPHARTTDTEWNSLAEKVYKTRARSGLAFSVNGRQTGVQAQRLMVKTMLRDGDGAVVFSKSQSGGALRGYYSGTQIGNARTSLDQSKWIDGLLLDSLDRIQAFRFPNRDGTFVDVPAESVRFLSRPDTTGQVRTMSVLTRACNKMVDIAELTRSWMKGIKAANEIGYYLTSQVDGQRPMGMDATLGTGKTARIRTPAGPLTIKLVSSTGGEIPSLPAGVDLKTLLDTRPHPNSREFTEDLIRDIAWGCGIAPDLLWSIVKLGSANTRYVLADAQVFVGVEQSNLVDSWLSQDWIYTLACEMKAGRLRDCTDPEWWNHIWVPPSRITIDYSKDGRVLMDMNKSGILSTERLQMMLWGTTAREECDAELDFVEYRKKGMASRGLTIDDLQPYNPMFARQPIAPGAPGYANKVNADDAPPPADQDDDEEEDDDDNEDDPS